MKWIEITVVVDAQAAPGFCAEPGVSYLLKSPEGSLLVDIGFGAPMGCFDTNANKVEFEWGSLDALVVTHLHRDHAGEDIARGVLRIPDVLSFRWSGRCFLPSPADVDDGELVLVNGPMPLAAGFWSTGPQPAVNPPGAPVEQAVFARLDGAGLVLISGCGHPGLARLVDAARSVFDLPLYAVVGGLHLGWSARGRIPENLEAAKAYLSPHDSSLEAMEDAARLLGAELKVLESGMTLRLEAT